MIRETFLAITGYCTYDTAYWGTYDTYTSNLSAMIPYGILILLHTVYNNTTYYYCIHILYVQ